MYGMPDMRSPLSEPGFASDRGGIRFGLYVETAFGLYQQLLQLRMHGLFRRLSHRSDQASDRRREDDDAGRHRHFLQRPLCRQYGRERLRSLCRALPDPSRAHGPLQRDADNPAGQSRPLYRMRRMRIDLPCTSDACHHRQVERRAQIRREAKRRRDQRGRGRRFRLLIKGHSTITDYIMRPYL